MVLRTPKILRARLPLAVKLEAVVHLTANIGYLLMVALALLVAPSVWLLSCSRVELTSAGKPSDSIESYDESRRSIRTTARGEIKTWPAQMGRRHIL